MECVVRDWGSRRGNGLAALRDQARGGMTARKTCHSSTGYDSQTTNILDINEYAPRCCADSCIDGLRVYTDRRVNAPHHNPCIGIFLALVDHSEGILYRVVGHLQTGLQARHVGLIHRGTTTEMEANRVCDPNRMSLHIDVTCKTILTTAR